MPDSDLLILTICSFTKAAGGNPVYAEDHAVVRRLGDLGSKFLKHRRRMRQWVIDQAEMRWNGQLLRQMELNRGLVAGQDFGRTAEAVYLPAVERYRGRFYMALGLEGPARVASSRHHYLIVSGLYGLVGLRESIQCYSCPVDPWSRAFLEWRSADAILTEALIAYLRSEGITRVLDLVANDTYRNLVDWSAIGQHLARVDGGVLHAYSSKAAGDGALSMFGRLVADREFDARADRLQAGQKELFEGSELCFQAEARPPEGWPVDSSLRWTLEDAVGRIRRGAVRFMNQRDSMTRTDGSSKLGFAARAERLLGDRRIDREDERALKDIGRLRDKVDYGEEHLADWELQKLREAYEYLRGREPDIPEFDADWETLANQLDWARG